MRTIIFAQHLSVMLKAIENAVKNHANYCARETILKTLEREMGATNEYWWPNFTVRVDFTPEQEKQGKWTLFLRSQSNWERIVNEMNSHNVTPEDLKPMLLELRSIIKAAKRCPGWK